jgi:hypothetical protein
MAMLSVVLALLAAVGCAALAGLAAAAVARARGLGAGTVAGLLVLVAVAAGAASAQLPLRAAYLAEPDSFPVVVNLVGDLLLPFKVFLAALIWALPWPVLGAAFGARTQNAGRQHAVRDVWQLLLDLATADLPGNRCAWGAALRAELAAIDPPAERRGFALGGVWAALRSGRPHGAWVRSAGVAVVVAGGSLAASRWSLAHDRGGVLSFWMALPSVLLFAVALAAAWRNRSFGSGLRTGALAGLAAMVAVLAVGIPEALVWAHQQAGYLSTGDAVPPTWQAAVGDVLRPEFLLGMIAFWAAGAAGGVALGTALGRLRTATRLTSPRPPRADAALRSRLGCPTGRGVAARHVARDPLTLTRSSLGRSARAEIGANPPPWPPPPRPGAPAARCAASPASPGADRGRPRPRRRGRARCRRAAAPGAGTRRW